MTLEYKGQEIDLGGAYETKLYDDTKNEWEQCPADLSTARMISYEEMEIPIVNPGDLIEYKKLLVDPRFPHQEKDIEAIQNYIGKESLSAFCNKLCRLIKSQKFDLIMGAGDSGQAMIWITKEIYKILDEPIPKTIVLPIYRHADEAETILFDNNIFAKELKTKVDLSSTNQILFVDDEVGSGTVINSVANLISAAVGDNKERIITILAENRRYNQPQEIAGNKTNFIPTRNVEPVIYNAISYVVSQDLRIKIKDVLEGLVEYPNEKLALNVL
jgi:hypoxanthine phosphoribosyltransferase